MKEIDELNKQFAEKFFMRCPVVISAASYFKLDEFMRAQCQDALVANVIRQIDAYVMLEHRDAVLAAGNEWKAALPRWMQRGRLRPKYRTLRLRVVRVLTTGELEMVRDYV